MLHCRVPVSHCEYNCEQRASVTTSTSLPTSILLQVCYRNQEGALVHQFGMSARRASLHNRLLAKPVPRKFVLP